MRIAIMAAITLLATACGSIQYQDTNAAVDARPECVDSNDSRPGEPVSPWCRREQGAVWSSDSGDEAPLDLDGGQDDD